jgi:hypothetical protein
MESIISKCQPFSYLSVERFNNNINSVNFVNANNIEGDIVEIGVYKGGSMLAMMLANEMSGINRHFHLYDTFEGMTPATDVDKDLNGIDATKLMEVNSYFRCIAPLDQVQTLIKNNTNISSERIHYYVGDVCKTQLFPEKIAILRLDTDWYESTKFELEHFYDRVVSGGIVIIDDYGHWQGCKKAVDEFMKSHPSINLQQIDYTGVFFLKS